MSVSVANTTLSDNINSWRLNHNLIATTLSNNVVTVLNSEANRGGSVVGNGHVAGTFTATTLRTDTISGGNTSVTNPLAVISNANFTGTEITIAANTTFTGNVDFVTSGSDRVVLGAASRIRISGGSNGQFLRVQAPGDVTQFKSLVLRDITDLSSNAASIILSGANTSFVTEGNANNSPALKWTTSSGDEVITYLEDTGTINESVLVYKLSSTNETSFIDIRDSSNTSVCTIDANGRIVAQSNGTFSGINVTTQLLPNSDDFVDLGAPNREFKNAYIDGTAFIDILSVASGASQGVDTSLIPVTTNTYNLGTNTRKWNNIWSGGTFQGYAAKFQQNLSVNGTFVANGIATFANGLSSGTGTITTLTLRNITQLGNLAFSNTSVTNLAVGKSTVDANYDFDVNRSVQVGKNLVVLGNTTISENLTVSGSFTVPNNATFTVGSGDFTNINVTGNTTLGSTSTQLININARFNDNIVPVAGTRQDVGASSSAWHNLYANNITIQDAATITNHLAVTKNVDISGNTNIDGTLTNGATVVIGNNGRLHVNNSVTDASIRNVKLENSTITNSADVGTNHAIVLGETQTFAGNNGIRTIINNNTTTIDGINSSTSQRGVASFNSADFSVSSGAVSIKTAGVSSSQLANVVTSGATIGSVTAIPIITYNNAGQIIGASTTALTFNSSDFVTSGGGEVSLATDITIDGQLNVGENAIIGGNLYVQGTTFTVDSETIRVADNIIVLNEDHTGTPTLDAGFLVERGNLADVSWLWNETSNRWDSGDQDIDAGTGTIYGATFTGNANTSTTLATARNIGGSSFNGSANINVDPQVEADNSTNATRYPVFVDTATGNANRLNTDTGFTYNPSTGIIDIQGVSLGNALAISNGGTGSATAEGARSALSAQANLVASLPSVSAQTSDLVLIKDTSNSNVISTDTVENISTAAPGSRILLETKTISSNTANVNFTTGINSTYDIYVIEILNAIPSEDISQPIIRTSSDGGSTYDTSGGDYRYVAKAYTAISSPVTSISGASSSSLIGLSVYGVGADVNENGFCGTIEIINPSAATYTRIHHKGSVVNLAGELVDASGSGERKEAAAVNAIQFRFGTAGADVASGIFNLYGIKK